MKVPKQPQAWNTEDEMRFVDQLGHQSHAGDQLSRSQLLKNYAASCGKRARWDAIDQKLVLERLRLRLNGAR